VVIAAELLWLHSRMKGSGRCVSFRRSAVWWWSKVGADAADGGLIVDVGEAEAVEDVEGGRDPTEVARVL
jgi:hypothetical protein